METSLDERARNVVLVGKVFKGSTAYQTINVKEKTLGERWSFRREYVLVESEITIENETKVEFKFTSAGLKFSNSFMLPVPPVGKGWFDNVYVGDGIACEDSGRYFDRRAVLKRKYIALELC